MSHPSSYVAIRDVDLIECPWLEPPVKKGEIVYAFTGHTYGVTRAGYIGRRFDSLPKTIVVTRDANGGLPFFELPLEALQKIEK